MDNIEADLFELCRNQHSGRTNNKQITVFKNVGGGHLDLFTARYMHETIEAGASIST